MLKFLELLGSLGIFLFGMKIMSDALQRVAGSRLKTVLNYMTNNRFMGVLTGCLVTAIIQSSSATTVMVVSFVNAGMLTLIQSIGVIMGANIGTTVTTWIVSFFGFKFKISAIALAIVGVGFPLSFMKNQKWKDIGSLLIGFGLLFIGLDYLKNSVPDIKHSPEVMSFLSAYTGFGFGSIILFVLVGTILTLVVQSSSASMAITVTMLYKGWIPLPLAMAMVLGENIGTTITANLAAITTNKVAKTAARAHFLFNVFGVMWMLVLFRPFSEFVLKITPWDSSLLANFPLNVSLFHTLFNIVNTCICIFLVKYIAVVSSKLVFKSEKEKKYGYSLQYLSTNLQKAPELELITAKNEIRKMLVLAGEMYGNYKQAYFDDTEDLSKALDNAKKQEDLSDKMQIEISKYLNKCNRENISEDTANNILIMTRVVNEIESICDYCYQLVFLTEKIKRKKYRFHEKAKRELEVYSGIVGGFIDFLKEHLDISMQKLHSRDLKRAYEIEDKINGLRNKLRKASKYRLEKNEEINIRGELIYMDLLQIFEHIGDKSLNIAQSLKKIKE